MSEDLEVQLEQLVFTIQAMAERADSMLADALGALETADHARADTVIAADVEVDRAYEYMQHGVLALVALHSPVGEQLRQATAMIHVSLHLERMADYAVNAARAMQRTVGLPADDELLGQLVTMGGHAREVGQQAVAAFATGDQALARTVAKLDDRVDQLDVDIFQRLVRLAGQDQSHLEWATGMIRLARHLERYGDHGVDIAEQVLFVATGTAVELAQRDAPTGSGDTTA